MLPQLVLPHRSQLNKTCQAAVDSSCHEDAKPGNLSAEFNLMSSLRVRHYNVDQLKWKKTFAVSGAL